jgi:repressor LexA
MAPEPKYLQKVKEFYWDYHRMPSYSEMAQLLGFRSRNAAVKVAEAWLKTGLVRRDERGVLMPGRLFMPIHLLGTVEAGFPSPAEEENVDTISLDDWLIKNKEASFMLKVSGESMIDAGIKPGDMVILERGKQPKNGDIVVAEVDHDWTIKYYQKRGAAVTLIPANKLFKPIVPREELKVAGVVTAVIRKY